MALSMSWQFFMLSSESGRSLKVNVLVHDGRCHEITRFGTLDPAENTKMVRLIFRLFSRVPKASSTIASTLALSPSLFYT